MMIAASTAMTAVTVNSSMSENPSDRYRINIMLLSCPDATVGGISSWECRYLQPSPVQHPAVG